MSDRQISREATDLIAHSALKWKAKYERERAECLVWMNGVADAVEHLGFDREAACGPADLLPGLKWLVERTDDCDDDCTHAPMCRKWEP